MLIFVLKMAIYRERLQQPHVLVLKDNNNLTLNVCIMVVMVSQCVKDCPIILYCNTAS